MLREDFPKYGEEPEFWKVMESKPFIQSVIFLMLNESRKCDPAMLNDAQCRTQLAKIKAYQELLDLPTALKVKDEGQDTLEDEIQ